MYMAVIKLTLYSYLNNFKEALIMNFQLTKEQEFVKEMVKKFAATQIGRARVGKECRSRWSPYH